MSESRWKDPQVVCEGIDKIIVRIFVKFMLVGYQESRVVCEGKDKISGRILGKSRQVDHHESRAVCEGTGKISCILGKVRHGHQQ